MKPVFGLNLRQAVKIQLLFSADLHEPKRHKYVDRRSKFSELSVQECFSVPSAVFNSFALSQRKVCGGYQDYLEPGCRVSDIEDTNAGSDGDEQMLFDGERPLVTDLIKDVTASWPAMQRRRQEARPL